MLNVNEVRTFMRTPLTRALKLSFKLFQENYNVRNKLFTDLLLKSASKLSLFNLFNFRP